MTLSEMLATADAATQNVDVGEGGFSPLPAGDYDVVVSECEGPLPTKRANPQNPNEFGHRLNITFTVTGGEYTGRKVFMNNNILAYPKTMSEGDIKSAQKCMAIGARERSVLLASVGKSTIANAAELIGATARITVEVRKMDNGTETNQVRRVSASGTKASPIYPPSAPSAPVAPDPAPAPAQRAKMPWEK